MLCRQLVAAPIGVIATLLGNIVQNIAQSSANRDLERQRFESSLIQKALETVDPEAAAQRLSFLVKLGFVRDASGQIAKYVTSPDSIPLQPQISEGGDNFVGVWRAKAKLSIGTGAVEPYPTLESLIAALPPESDTKSGPATTDRSPTEQRNVRVKAFVYAAKREVSNDIKLIIGPDRATSTKGYMFAVVSGLPAPASPGFATLQSVRDSLKSLFGENPPGNSYDSYDPPIPVEVEGSLFLNTAHAPGTVGPRGLNRDIRTRWEIRPITHLIAESRRLR
jgi:hypothetical protein